MASMAVVNKYRSVSKRTNTDVGLFRGPTKTGVGCNVNLLCRSCSRRFPIPSFSSEALWKQEIYNNVDELVI